MKRILVGFLVVGVTGCANVKVMEPTTYTFDRSRTYQMPFDKVWARAVDWFADHNVAIEKIEKESGLITAKYLLKANDTYLDCGKFEVTGTLGQTRIDSFGSLNVTVRKVSDSESKVTANFFGQYRLDGQDAWDRRPVTAKGSCVSTGHLEKDILSFIER